MVDKSSPEERFVAHLASYVEKGKRAELAALRRGLGKPPGSAPEMYPLVVPWLPAGIGLREEEAYYLTASLFAAHPEWWRASESEKWGNNLGASFYRLAKKKESGSIEKRFMAILNSQREDLSVHLRHAVSLFKSGSIPVDWVCLLRDLRGWDREDRLVQRNWAKSFWGYFTEESQTDEDISEESEVNV